MGERDRDREGVPWSTLEGAKGLEEGRDVILGESRGWGQELHCVVGVGQNSLHAQGQASQPAPPPSHTSW